MARSGGTHDISPPSTIKGQDSCMSLRETRAVTGDEQAALVSTTNSATAHITIDRYVITSDGEIRAMYQGVTPGEHKSVGGAIISDSMPAQLGSSETADAPRQSIKIEAWPVVS